MQVFDLFPITWTSLSAIFTAALAAIAFFQIRNERGSLKFSCRVKNNYGLKRSETGHLVGKNNEISSIEWIINVFNVGNRSIWITNIEVRPTDCLASFYKENNFPINILPGQHNIFCFRTASFSDQLRVSGFALFNHRNKKYYINKNKFRYLPREEEWFTEEEKSI